MTRKYRMHWSDNYNQLSGPSVASNTKEAWPPPWVYVWASSLNHAKQMMAKFNATCEVVEPGPRAAHMPMKRLAEHGFSVVGSIFPLGNAEERS